MTFITSECQNARKDIVLLVDVSGGVQLIYDLTLTLIKKIIMMLNVDSGDVRLALVTYDTSARVAFKLNSFQVQNMGTWDRSCIDLSNPKLI